MWSRAEFPEARGFILVSVLWLIVLLGVIAAGLAYGTRQTTQGVSHLVGGTQARYLADGAAQLVMVNLLSRNPMDRMLADGETLELELPGGTARVRVEDENGKIDINVARANLLARLFYSLDVEQSVADALADAILDYRDEDDLVRLHGAEDEAYLAEGLSWGAKDALFTSVDELRNVFGMTREIYEKVLPYVTIYSRHQGVNPEVAPLPVLMAISEDSAMALENYVETRRRNYRDGLPLPGQPVIDRQFLSRTRGITYTLSAVGITESGMHSGLSTTVRIRRGRNRLLIETLNWEPYILKTEADDGALWKRRDEEA